MRRWRLLCLALLFLLAACGGARSSPDQVGQAGEDAVITVYRAPT